MGEPETREQLHPVILAGAKTGSCPLPYPINGEESGFLKWRREEGRRGMGFMMLRKDNLPFETEFFG
jgi:hypothetical protein